MLLHQLAKAVDVDGLPALLGELDRELDRKAVGRRERERVLAADPFGARELVEQAHPAHERLVEPLLFRPDDPLDFLRVLAQLGIGVGHLLDDDTRQPVDVGEADPLRLVYGAANDATKYVPSPLVRGRDAVTDEERHPAAVVGEDSMRFRRSGRVAVRDARLVGDPPHDVLVAVGLVDRDDALQNGRGALEAHACVDVLLRQRRQRPVRVELELHEDEVPELDEALAAVAARLAVGLAAAQRDTAVVIQLGIRSARPRAADGPEVLRCRQRHDPLRRQPDLLPELDRHLVGPELQLRVAREDARPDVVPVELHVLAHELRRVFDRAVFEVLAEREIAEHLEERQVMTVCADLVDVWRAEALLHGRRERRRRRLPPEEERHLGLHARGSQQCRAVVRARNQRSRRAA